MTLTTVSSTIFEPFSAAAVTPATDEISQAAFLGWWMSQPALQAMVTQGRLWHLEAPEGAAVEPYVTFFLISEVATEFTTGFTYYTSTFQINVHHRLPGLASPIAWQIAQAMNALNPAGRAVLAIHGTNSIHVLPDSFTTQLGEGLGLGGRDCWICSFEVEVPWTG